MTVIVDPAGTPEVIYSDPSISIYTIAATGTNAGGAAQLTRYSAINCVTVTADQDARGVKLPAAQEGDYFELYAISGDPLHYFKVYDSGGGDVSTSASRSIIRYIGGAWRPTSGA